MKYHGVKRIWKSPYYVNRKEHFCPACDEQLQKITVSQIVNRKSPEARDFDFSSFEGSMTDNVKFIWTELKCPKCENQLTIDEMKRIEKGLTKEEMLSRNKRINAIAMIFLVVISVGLVLSSENTIARSMGLLVIMFVPFSFLVRIRRERRSRDLMEQKEQESDGEFK